MQQVAQAPPRRLALRLQRRPRQVPRRPASRQLVVHQVQQRLHHMAPLRLPHQLVRDRGQPASEAERHLPVDHPAQALAQLAHQLGALNGHLGPRAPAARQPAVEHVAETTLQRSALAGTLLPRGGPSVPAESELPVDEVAQSLRHQIITRRKGGDPPIEAERKLALHHPAQTHAQLAHQLGPFSRHLSPRAPAAARQATVEHVAGALAHQPNRHQPISNHE